MRAFVEQRLDGGLDEDGLIEDHLADEFFRDVEQMLHRVLDAVHDRDGVGVPALFEHRQVDRRLAIHAHHVGLDLLRVLGIADVGDADRRLPDGLHRQVVDLLDGAQLAVGVDVVVQHADLHIAGRQNQVGIVHGADHVHQAQLVRFQFVGVRVDHDLAVPAAERLRHAGAGHAGNLVAHLELSQIAQRGFVQALALERHQAHREAGSIELQHDRRQRARGKAAQLRHREIGDGSHRRVRIGARLEVDLDDADAGKGARFDVLDAAAEREEAFEAAGDVGLDLLRRHAGIERGHDHHRDVHRREHVDGHAGETRHAHDRDEQADDDDEIWIADGKAGHDIEFLGYFLQRVAVIAVTLGRTS